MKRFQLHTSIFEEVDTKPYGKSHDAHLSAVADIGYMYNENGKESYALQPFAIVDVISSVCSDLSGNRLHLRDEGIEGIAGVGAMAWDAVS